jgi:hypothetical protein
MWSPPWGGLLIGNLNDRVGHYEIKPPYIKEVYKENNNVYVQTASYKMVIYNKISNLMCEMPPLHLQNIYHKLSRPLSHIEIHFHYLMR